MLTHMLKRQETDLFPSNQLSLLIFSFKVKKGKVTSLSEVLWPLVSDETANNQVGLQPSSDEKAKFDVSCFTFLFKGEQSLSHVSVVNGGEIVPSTDYGKKTNKTKEKVIY